MWIAEMQFGNDWVRLPGEWESRDSAEWYVASWKQAHPFRYREIKAIHEGHCELCGEPMPEGEKMFRFHGHSGPCPVKEAANGK